MHGFRLTQNIDNNGNKINDLFLPMSLRVKDSSVERSNDGDVIDFIYFSLINFPVFNMADIYVVCSGILLVILVCFKYKNDEDYDFLRIKKD